MSAPPSPDIPRPGALEPSFGTPDLTAEARRLYQSLLAERAAARAVRTPVRGRSHPLSTAQERLWRLAALAEGTAWGNLPLAFAVRGSLRLDALEAALRDVVRRQEILRTRYEEIDGAVRGHVEPVPAPLLSVRQSAPPATGDDAMRAAVEWARAEARRPLDPRRGIPFRAAWHPAGADAGVLFLLTHHLAADGWAMGLLLRELSAAYAARLQGRPPDLPPLERRFGDLAAEERATKGSAAPQAVAHWLERLEGAPPQVPLPGDPAPVRAALDCGRVYGAIEAEPAAALRALAAAEGLTVFGAWLAVLQVLHAVYSETSDIVLGTTVSIRDGAERERLVGNFGNNLLLRGQLARAGTFGDVLRGVRETLPRDLAHQGVSVEQLLRDAPGRIRIPRLNVLFMLREAAPEDYLLLPGCHVEHLATEVGAAPLDLVWDVWDRGAEGFTFLLEHRSARIDGDEAAAAVRDVERLVREVVAEPEAPLDRLPIARGRWRADGSAHRSPARAGRVNGRMPASEKREGAARRASEADAPPTPATRPSSAETRLCGIWREALGVEAVDVHDNFFELGGHSLLAMTVLERIESELGLRLTPVDLVTQTLAQLAGRAGVGSGAATPAAPARAADTRRPPGIHVRGPRGTTFAPLRLGAGTLAGVLHAPADRTPRRVGVLCPPILHEYQLSHRTLKSLAERLAADGAWVLRMDYRGIGDSEGSIAIGSPGAWAADVKTALAELRGWAAGLPAFLFGLRLGAAVAIEAAATLGEPPGAVFAWAPTFDGERYLEELDRAHFAWFERYRAQHGKHADASSEHGRVLGQPFPPALRQALASLGPPRGAGHPSGLVLLESEGDEMPADTLASLERLASPPVLLPGPVPWREHPDIAAPAVPAEALDAIAARVRAQLP